MKERLLACVCALFLCHISFAQMPDDQRSIDSINQLLKKEKNQKRIWELILKRAIRYPVGAYDQAVADARNVLSEAQQAKDTEGTVEAYITLGNIHHKNRKYAEALGYDSLALKLALKDRYPKGESLAFGNIAREQQATGNIQEAKQNYRKALELALALPERDTDRLLFCYNQLGVVSRVLGNFQQSVEYLDEGIRLASEEGNNRLLALLYMNIGNTFAETSRYTESAEMHLKSIAIKEQMNDSLGLSQSYGNLAIVFRNAKDFDKAIFYFGKGKDLATKMNSYTTLGLTASNLAVTYIEKKDFDSVRHFFEEAILNFEKIKDMRGLGLVYHNYGKFLFDTKELDTAEVLMKKALDVRTRIGSKTEMSSSLANLGKLYMERGKMDLAEARLLEAKAMLDTTLKTSGLRDVFSYLSALYAKKSDYSTAFYYQAKVLELEKSMFTESERVDILKAEANYELEKREIQLAHERERQHERLIKAILAGALIISILMAVTIMSLFRRRQAKERHQTELHQMDQQHRIETARALRLAEEEERKKIAAKLHDEVGAQLSIARLNVNQLQSDLFVADSEAGMKLQAAQKLLGDMSETIRAISHSLMPIALEKYGLKSAILDLVDAINASDKIKVEEVIEGLDDAKRWEDEFCVGVYRIVQEVLNNIIKHAQATHVLVQMVELESSITIYVEDNGKGLDKNKQHDGAGLKLLQRNIEYFSGTIEINGRENQGTFVLIELPLEMKAVS